MNRRLSLLALGAVACGSGEPSPDALCKHVLQVAKKSGAAISAEGDPIARCVAEQKELKERLGAETYGKVASCIMSKSDIAAMMNDCNESKLAGKSGGGPEEYIKKSKGTEALTSVKMMAFGARAFAEEGRVEAGSLQAASGFPSPSAGPTPPIGACCKAPGGKCAPDPSLWAEPPWRDLVFAVEHPHYYSYEYKVEADGKKFTALAYGDLDCDGTHSTFSATGEIGADGVVTVGEVVRESPLE